MVEDRGTKHFLGKPMSNNHGRSFELNHPHYLNHGLLPPPIFKHRKHCESYKSTSTSTHRRTSSQPMQQQHHSHHSLHHAYSSHHQPPPHFKSQHHKNAAHHSQPPQQTVVPHRSMPSSRISTAEHDSPASFANANAISSVASTSYPCTLPNSTTLSHQSDLLSRSDSLTSSIDSSNATSGIQIRTDDKRTPSSSLSLSTSSSSLSLLSASQIPPKQGVVYHEQRSVQLPQHFTLLHLTSAFQCGASFRSYSKSFLKADTRPNCVARTKSNETVCTETAACSLTANGNWRETCIGIPSTKRRNALRSSNKVSVSLDHAVRFFTKNRTPWNGWSNRCNNCHVCLCRKIHSHRPAIALPFPHRPPSTTFRSPSQSPVNDDAPISTIVFVCKLYFNLN